MSFNNHLNRTIQFTVKAKINAGLLCLLIALPPAALANLLPKTDYDIFLDNVELRPGVNTNLHLRVFVNENAPCSSGFRTLFAVHGFGHSAATWEFFADALFARQSGGLPVCRVVALDLPGNGLSTVPTGLLYSNLSLQDYAAAVTGALERLPRQGLRPTHILGHSQGGLVVQLAQQAMFDQGTSLRQEFNIVVATLLAPVPPEAVPWALAESGLGAQLIDAFLVNDPDLGEVIFFPGAVFPALFFTNLNNEVVPGTPPVEVLDEFAFPEPLQVALELNGLPPATSRPQVESLVFADRGLITLWRGTFLQAVSFENDTLARPGEVVQTYVHLSGDSGLRRYAEVVGGNAVHDMYISDPAGILQAVAGRIHF